MRRRGRLAVATVAQGEDESATVTVTARAGGKVVATGRPSTKVGLAMKKARSASITVTAKCKDAAGRQP